MSNAADASVLRARGLRKEYGKGEGLVRAVDGVDLDVGAGETVAVMGPSGCGKSTLLHLLGGLDRPSGGEVSLNGRRIDDLGEKALARMRRTAVGFVFQAFHLMEELTAVENVELSALLAGRSPRAARRRAEELLEQVGLTDRARFLPSALSGGQRQRVAIARALSNEAAMCCQVAIQRLVRQRILAKWTSTFALPAGSGQTTSSWLPRRRCWPVRRAASGGRSFGCRCLR